MSKWYKIMGFYRHKPIYLPVEQILLKCSVQQNIYDSVVRTLVEVRKVIVRQKLQGPTSNVSLIANPYSLRFIDLNCSCWISRSTKNCSALRDIAQAHKTRDLDCRELSKVLMTFKNDVKRLFIPFGSDSIYTEMRPVPGDY